MAVPPARLVACWVRGENGERINLLEAPPEVVDKYRKPEMASEAVYRWAESKVRAERLARLSSENKPTA